MKCHFPKCVDGCRGHFATYVPNRSTIKFTVPGVGRMYPQESDFNWFVGQTAYNLSPIAPIEQESKKTWVAGQLNVVK